MRIVEKTRSDRGADLDIFYLGYGDLYLTLRGEKAVDLTVQTVFGNENEGADTGDQGAAEKAEEYHPETECEERDRLTERCREVGHHADKSHQKGEKQIQDDRDDRSAQIELDRVIFICFLFQRFETHMLISLKSGD